MNYKELHKETALKAFNWEEQARKDAIAYMEMLVRTGESCEKLRTAIKRGGFQVFVLECKLVLRSLLWGPNTIEVPFDWIKDPALYELKQRKKCPVENAYKYLEFMLDNSESVVTKTLVARLLRENPGRTGTYVESCQTLYVPDRTYGGFVRIAIPKDWEVSPSVDDGVIDLV